MKLGMFASPGSYPDKPLADIVDWYIKVVEKAEEVGYSEFWMASHVISRWARIACPRQFIARALATTHKIRLGTAVEVLYQQNPVTLAAQIGELDQVSRGRLILGVGAGALSDLLAYGLEGSNPAELSATAHHMMLESLDIMLNCWQEGGPQDFDGRFWKVRRPSFLGDVDNHAWHLRPYGSIDDRIAVAGFSAKSHALTVAGERGYIPLSWSVSREFAEIQWASLSEGARRSGQAPDRSKWRQAQVIYVAETDKEARVAVVDGFAGTLWKNYWEPVFEKTGVLPYLQRRIGKPDTELNPTDLIDSGIWFVGTPDRVARQLKEQEEAFGGFGTVLQVGFDYSGPGAAGWMRSMELLAREVIPKVQPAPLLAEPAHA
jgi:alkanesulfonate monooxygenase SsuD/methylene tetrahydromethanopterin reductase-like flavin-dependent oxidoreductase (luciferase family)